ncbi:beta-propeller domain-containing protein [Actinophytocola sp.]|uniref:beta-propeller domain-containing protein n=1 Tax=Actinophytocola sp. TaxID=1872138 RepID=UPI002D2F2FC6|nr:beta-propeller domain-containing protein [Actinophytocola sp.]HYQ66343.1 beta-propeller domain-containing protein [Actinophytocola sp.]
MTDDLPSRRPALIVGLVMTLGAGMIAAGMIVGAADGTSPAPHKSGDLRLVAYDSCGAALTQLKDRIMPHVGPYGLDIVGRGEVFTGGRAEDSAGGGKMAVPDAAPPEAPRAEQGPDHSTTNVHEGGVDEPDLVKTDGKRVVSITDGVLRVVDVHSRTQTAAVRLADQAYPTQLLVDGDRALVMSIPIMTQSVPDIAPGKPTTRPVPTDTVPYETRLSLIDLTGAGKVLGTLSVDGSYLDARQVGDVARVVVHSTPHLPFRYPTDGDQPSALHDNQEVVANSTIQDWLPRYELRTGGATSNGQLTECADMTHPADYTATGMLTVLSFDLTHDLGTGDPVTIVADGSTVYGTEKNLYVANDHTMTGMVDTPMPTPASARTELYQFDISRPGRPVHVASGAVDGGLLNQYSMSEYQGHLRVATTRSGQGGPESLITVLRREGSELTQVGQVGGLGEVGERIYAVRYFGDTGYVVTFRRMDPLYTVDLRDPTAPKVTGELKITGYSAYLHPAGDGRLIGVGQGADANGGVQGAQVSLFDTSDPAGAKVIAQYQLGGGWTEAENDPHAFLYWPAKHLLVLPVSGGPDQTAGALVLRLGEGSFERARTLTHPSDRYGGDVLPRRALVIGDELWTVSPAGMLVSGLDSLSQLAWLPFS